MNGLLADYNVKGQLERLVAVLLASEFAGEWKKLGLTLESFQSLGLPIETADRVLWSICQNQGLILVTANRNHEGVDSLEAAIRDCGPTALPVLTLGKAGRVLIDSAYARAAALSLMEYLLDLVDRPETVLGTGRLYLPKNPI